MTQNFSQKNLGLSVTSSLGDDDLLLRAFHGEDRISGLFHYQLELISEKPDLDMAAIVGESMTAKMLHPAGEYMINGLVARFVQAGTNHRFTTYYAELRPWLWMLTMVVDSRIFQEKSTTEIIEELFGDAGFSDFRIDCKGTYNPREYCVQYQESVFDFISRLMEDEGIFYFWEHEEEMHTMVLADDTSAHVEREGQEAARVSSADSSSGTEPTITHIALEQQVTVGGYALTDYDFEQPAGDLGVNVQGEKPELEVFEYPGKYVKKGDGEGLVKLRIESHELPAKLVRGQSHCRGFMSGFKIVVEEHLREDLNGEYVLRWVSHNANTTRYSNTFEAFPADIPFRPARVTRKPRITGAQSAKVVGASGEEIYTDKYGRIKVHFPWDRKGSEDDKSTCFIRVAQGWAGKGWGAFFLPRIGQEVLVSFLDGDPDRPIITGSVYNAEQTVPYALPGAATKSTVKGSSSKDGPDNDGNEIRFEDKKGDEEIYIFAEKDFNIVVINDHTLVVGNDQDIKIKMNKTTLIEEGDMELEVAKGNRKESITKGDAELFVGGTRKVEVKGAEDHINKDNFNHEVAGDYTLKVDGKLTIEATGEIKIKGAAAVNMEAGTAFKAKAGTDMDLKAGTGFKGKAGTVMDMQGGVAFKAKGGAQASVEGGGMLTLKGGLVKIN